MDYVNPSDLIAEVVRVAKRKAALSVRDMLLRGALAGAFLGFATSLVFMVQVQGVPPVVGALIFPVGFVMLVLLGLELATGNFALLPAAVAAGEVTLGRMLRNWWWVYFGNLLGSLGYALLFYLAITNCGLNNGGPVGDLLRAAAQKKTLGYMAGGGAGWATALIKAVLCNWMVTVGAVLALVSRSTIGKVVAMWLPIFTFFAQGFEHSIVNMFVIPTGMLLNAPVSAGNWWLWNQIPVTIGNILAGSVFTGLALYTTFGRKPVQEPAAARPSWLRRPSNRPTDNPHWCCDRGGKPWDRQPVSGKLRRKLGVSPGFAAYRRPPPPKRLSTPFPGGKPMKKLVEVTLVL